MKPLYITEAEVGMLYDVARIFKDAELMQALLPRLENIMKEFERENEQALCRQTASR